MKKQKKEESLAAMGATVQLGCHEGCFIADILDAGSVIVVRAEPAKYDTDGTQIEPGGAHPSKLHRSPMPFSEPTHLLMDFPEKPTLWDDRRGVFVVPRAQLKRYIDGKLED